MRVKVTSITPHGSISIGEGETLDANEEPTGRTVRFGIDWRAGVDIATALEFGEDIITDIEQWQILSAVSA